MGSTEPDPPRSCSGIQVNARIRKGFLSNPRRGAAPGQACDRVRIDVLADHGSGRPCLSHPDRCRRTRDRRRPDAPSRSRSQPRTDDACGAGAIRSRGRIAGPARRHERRLPPFSDWPKGQAEPRGFSIDVARAFARSQRAVIEWVRFEWPGLERDLVAGRFDLVLSGVTVRPDRSITGRFALPLTSSGLVVLVPEHSAMRWSSDLDRPSTRLAVNAGGHLERTIRRLLPEAGSSPSPTTVASSTGFLRRATELRSAGPS